mgnify:FL=1
MTLEEAKELETKIANDILNNLPLSMVVQAMSAEAQARAKKLISEATEEQLTEIKEKIEEAEAKAAEAKKNQETPPDQDE